MIPLLIQLKTLFVLPMAAWYCAACLPPIIDYHPQILLLCDTLQNYPLHPVISIFIILSHPQHPTFH